MCGQGQVWGGEMRDRGCYVIGDKPNCTHFCLNLTFSSPLWSEVFDVPVVDVNSPFHKFHMINRLTTIRLLLQRWIMNNRVHGLPPHVDNRWLKIIIMQFIKESKSLVWQVFY